MSYYVGIDLHSDNNYTGVIDKEDSRIFGKKLPNDLDGILKTLEPFRKEIQGIVVESTYNWYWLVDGLMEAKGKTEGVKSFKLTSFFNDKDLTPVS